MRFLTDWLVFALISTAWTGKASTTTNRGRQRRVHVHYPIRLLAPITGSQFSANVTRDELVCFGNRDYSEPSYLQALFCMFAMVPLPYVSEMLTHRADTNSSISLASCNGIWGSRSVIVDARGSVEFLKVGKLPAESNFVDETVALNATRWLELPTSSSKLQQREIKQVPAEPIYLCARSSDWTGRDAFFSIRFRPVYIRERDKVQCMKKISLHVAFLLAVSSVWLLPYLAALVVAAVTYALGINKFMMALGFSCCLVCMAPLLLTKKNRHLTSLYFKYFFTRVQAEETRMVIRQRLPVFQALFFSSAVMCVGSASSYIIYSYFGVDRETRNAMIKITMGLSSSWFVFFVCRSFERFFRDWLWLAMSVGLAQLLDIHLNPLSRDEIMVVTILISFLFKLFFPRVILLARRNSRINKLLATATGGIVGLVLVNNDDAVHSHHYSYSQQVPQSLSPPPAAADDLNPIVEVSDKNNASTASDPLSEEEEEDNEDEDDNEEEGEDEEGEDEEDVDADNEDDMVNFRDCIANLTRCTPPPEAVKGKGKEKGKNTGAVSSGLSFDEELAALLREELGELEDNQAGDNQSEELLGLLTGSWTAMSSWSFDSHEANQSQEATHAPLNSLTKFRLFRSGYCPVPVHVLGPITIDGRRIWLPMVTSDHSILRLVRQGLSFLGPFQSREFTPLSEYRRVVVRAGFSDLHSAAGFVSWMKHRRNVDALLNLANSCSYSAIGASGRMEEAREEEGQLHSAATIELVSISSQAFGASANISFKYKSSAVCSVSGGVAARASSERVLFMTRKVLEAIKQDHQPTVRSMRVDLSAFTTGLSSEHSPGMGVQCIVSMSSTGGGEDSPVAVANRLMRAHTLCRRLTEQRVTKGGACRDTVSDSSRAVISAVSSLLTALAATGEFDPMAAFDAAGFVAELTEEESDDNLALTITMPVLFGASAASTASFATEEAQRVGKQCLVMLRGRPCRLDKDKDSDHKISREVTVGVSVLTAAAYLGSLLRFSRTEQFRAAWAE